MTGRQWTSIFSAVFMAALAAVGFCLLVAKLQDIIALFAIGFVIAYVLDPLLIRLERRGWSRARAVWTVMLAFVLVVSGIGAIVVPQLVGQVEDAVQNWDYYSAHATTLYEQTQASITDYVRERYPDPAVIAQLNQKLGEVRQQALGGLSAVVKWVSGRVLGAVNVVALSLLVFVITFHFMMVIDAIRKVVVESMPEKQGESLEHISVQINAMLGQYVRGEAIACVLVAIVATMLLTIVKLIWGTNYGLIVGVVTGVTYVIPYVGPAVSVTLAGFFGYVTATHDPLVACLVSAGAMVLTNQLFDVILTPKIVGGRIGLHPLMIMFAVFAGLKLMGVPGMVIATPIAASIKIALMRWLPIKGLEEGEPLPKHKPLHIDIARSITQARSWARTMGHRLEHAINGEEE